MRRFAIAATAVATIGFGAFGCQKVENSQNINEKLDQILAKIEKLEKAGPARAGAAKRPSRPRPKPTATYSVPVAGAPSEGPADAQITIVKGFEFACPYCYKVKPTLAQLQKDYGDKIRIVYKNFIVHPSTARTPALASCAAHQQGKYVEMADLIWTKGFNAGRNLSAANMEKIAGGLGLDMTKFKKDMNGPECQKTVSKDQQELSRVGTTGTPAFYINGRFLSGARPVGQFKAIVEEELKKADAAIAKGTPKAKYYEEFVVKKGKKSL